MSQPPIISDAKISRTLLGAYLAIYKCPHCREELKSKEEDIGELDSCPHCSGQFMLSVSVKNKVDELLKIKSEIRGQKRQRKKQSKLERQQEKEEQRKRQEEQRKQVELQRQQEAREKREREQELKDRAAQMIATTAPFVDGYQIVDYLGIDGVEYVTGTGMIAELSEIGDLFGLRSTAFESKLRNGRLQALQMFRALAARAGANAIIGIDFDYSEFSSNRTAVIVTGTMVRIEKRVRHDVIEFDEE